MLKEKKKELQRGNAPLLGVKGQSPLYFGENLFNQIVEFCGKGKVVIVADRAVEDLYGRALAKRVGAELLTISGGERTKTLESAMDLMSELFKIGAGRDTTLVAVGGGVTTDLVAFVASIYLRGVPLILVPTTLLAIVDASIGGKTAVDTSFGKNLIGTFYPAKAIFSDLKTLETLPEREWLNGLAEILKMGLILDASIWEMDERDPSLIQKAIEGKIAVVEQDPEERSLRRILNFGHTIGHALEAISCYEMSHGEAVALGCCVEAHLSMRLGYLSEEDFARVRKKYERFFLKLPKEYRRSIFLQALSYDKKRAAGQMRFVLIDRIGHAIPFGEDYCTVVTPDELEPTLDWMERVFF